MTNSKLGKFLFKNTTAPQTIAKNTFWLSFGEITGRLLRVVLIFFAARILGAAGWGIFSYMTSIAAVLTVFSDMGLNAILVKEGSKGEQLRREYFATSMPIKLVLVSIGLLIVVFVSPNITNLNIPPLLVYMVGILFLFDAVRRYISFLFRAEERMEYEALTNIFTQIILVSTGFFVLFRYGTPTSLAGAYALGSGLGLVLVSYITRHYIAGIKKYFRKDLIKEIFSAGWPLGIAVVFGTLLVNIDTVMVGWFKEAVDVGFYAAAQKPIAFLYLLPGFIAGGLLPALSKRAKVDPAGFRKILEEGIAVSLLIALPIAVGVLLVAGPIIELVYGSEFLPSSIPFRILSATLLITFPAMIIIQAVFAYSKQKAMVPIWGFGIIFNIVLNLLLIPTYGIAGAAWASLLSQVLINTILWIKMKRINNFSVIQRVGTILGATLFMGLGILGLIALGFHVLTIIAISIPLYLIGLLVLKDKTVGRIREAFS